MWIGRYNRFNFRLRIGLQINKRYQKTRPLRTDRSHEVPRNSTRETPLVTLDADHLKPRGPHPLLRIQHRDHTSLHTSGIITYYQNTPPTYRQKLRGTPKFHQGDSTCHPECRSPQATGTTPTSADTAYGPHFTTHFLHHYVLPKHAHYVQKEATRDTEIPPGRLH